MATKENIKEENRGKSLSSAWSQFIPCILLHLLMPLLPLGLERFFEGHLSEKSMAITAAMYAVALAISSRWTWFVFTGIFVSVVYASMFGAMSYAVKLGKEPDITTYAGYGIVMLFLAHIAERYTRHITLREPFFEFNTR